MSVVEYKIYVGNAITPLIERVSEMRVHYFREYPYLYDGVGQSDYEKQYLAELAQNDRAIVVCALDGSAPIGVATGLPLVSGADILEGIESRFLERGYQPSSFYYLSEVIVDPIRRGSGIGKSLIGRLEGRASKWGFTRSCLATVARDDDDIRRPPEYKSPTPLWSKLGYFCTDIQFEYEWQTFEDDQASRYLSNVMDVWIKDDLVST